MKIAFVNDTFLEGRGADMVIYEIAKRLGKEHEVFVITSESDIKEENFKILKIKSKKLLTGNNFLDSILYFPKIFMARKEISNLKRKYSFDIFNIHHSSLAPALSGFPTIVTWHGSPPSKNFLRNSLNKNVLKFLNKSLACITVSDYLKEELKKLISNVKIKTIHNGVSEEFSASKKDKGFMLFVGRMEKHKKIHKLIRLSKDLNYPLHIIGSGPLEQYLKDYAKRMNADKVKFLGKISRENLIKEYQECSFFVTASEWEGFGLIFIEAASCGKPSIGYNKGSTSEIIINGKTGFFVDNYNELKEKSEILIKNRKLRNKFGREALKHSKKFNWDKCAKSYSKLFSESLS